MKFVALCLLLSACAAKQPPQVVYITEVFPRPCTVVRGDGK